MLQISVQLQANPIAIHPPVFFVSELMFDSQDEWVLEVNSIYFDVSEEVDSVCIRTSNGSAKWKDLMLFDDEGFPVQQKSFTIRKENLDSDLTINKSGDFVEVTTYYKASPWSGSDEEITNTLIFGNYPGATVRSPIEGESIVHVIYYYDSPDDNPMNVRGYVTYPCYSKLYAIATTGESDSKVCMGKVRATIHNSTDQPFSEYRFQLRDENYYTRFDMFKQTEGVYEGYVYACSYNFDKLYPWNEPWLNYWNSSYRHDSWIIEPVRVEMEQGAVIYLDINISKKVNIQTVKPEEDHVLKIYPNPIVGNSFYYETALPVKSATGGIEIMGLNGQKIGYYPIFENTGNIKLPSDISGGIYTVSLIVNNKKYAAAKIVVP